MFSKYFKLLILLSSVSLFAQSYHFVGAEFPKITEQDPNGKLRGYGIEVTKLLANKLKADVSIDLYPLKRAMTMMSNGEADVIIGPYKSKARSEYLDYSNFYFYEDPIYLYSPIDSKLKWNGRISSLKKFKIGVVSGWSYGDEFDSMAKTLKLVYVNTPKQIFFLLKHKRVDFILIHPRAASGVISKAELTTKYKQLTPAVIVNRGYFGFSKKKNLKDFKKKFEMAYAEAMTRGELSKLYKDF